MTRSVAVLALDAADYRLVQDWECDNLLLENHGALETFAHTYDYPHTSEVWPTVATGLEVTEHGITPKSGTSDWHNPILTAGSSLANAILPGTVTDWIGARLLERGAKRDITPTASDGEALNHVFDAVYQWPGLTDADHLAEAWRLLRWARQGHLTEDELETTTFRNTRDELMWLVSQRGLVGAHAHILDVMGHTYCRREAILRDRYRRVDRMVGILADSVDELVILSDHGMQVSHLGDDEPGEHSWWSYVATTIDRDLPSSVFDIAAWLDAYRPERRSGDRPVVADAAAETLENLYGIDVNRE